MVRLFRIIKRLTIIVSCIALLLSIVIYLYMRQPQFGKAPSGKRLERIKQSPNYKDGMFQNIHSTPVISEGYTMAGEVYKTFLKKNPRKKPTDVIPSEKTNLLALSPGSNVLIWFGHSSYFLQIDGKRFLIDPIFSGSASPFFGGVKSFKGTDIYSAMDMPEIDFLLISHDHYDHLDYKTIIALKPKVKNVICGLGVGEHFEYWGYDPSKIIEKDWNETVSINENFKIHTATTRHGSGRTLTRNNTLWMSYIINAPTQKIYVGGDSGYDTHFAEIGKKYGPFDLAILDNGQYNMAWKNIHMLPEEVIKAAKDLQAKRIFPVHSSKFVLGRHPWDEPLKEITRLSEMANLSLVTPLIGETVNLNDSIQVFTQWWKGLN